MSVVAPRAAPLARHRLLDLLGVARHVRRGRYAPPSTCRPATGEPVIVLVEGTQAAGHPLLRAILRALGIDAGAVRVVGAPLADRDRVLLALGARGVDAVVKAPTIADLARDPAAKRALWRSLRAALRHA